MSFDLLLQRETDANWSRGGAAPLPLEFSAAERRALQMLEASTRAHVVEVLGWARQRGIPARLSTQAVVYTPEVAARHYQEGRSSIKPGTIGWHHVGRAYHLVIIVPGTKKLDEAAYARVAAFARSRGGDWLGDKVVNTPRGPVKDTAHFEFHPDLELWAYRKTPLAQVEFKRAQERARKYG